MTMLYDWLAKKFTLILVCVGLFLSGLVIGYVKGEGAHEVKDLKETIVQVQKVDAHEKKTQEVSNQTGSVVEAKKEKVRIVYRNVDREVIKYVQTNPSSSDIIADPEWVRLFNASSLGCNPAEATCNARSEVSDGITRAEALEVAKEQHRLYHECRETVTGWQNFYGKLMEETNGNQSRTTTSDSWKWQPSMGGSDQPDNGEVSDRQSE